MDGAAGGAEGHGFVVLFFLDIEGGAGAQAQIIEELEKFFVFFVDADDFGFVAGLQIGKRNGALFAELGDATADGDAMRTAFFFTEAFE